ncbi:MAG: hypothetical protein JSV88_13550 [Candidatus Aminicenantes bacterium]|nr:MAG: hypothetical protein JSV88_13550 [Candidatus Aminicenantes bacterium]
MKMQIESGVYTIGPNKTNFKRFTVKFKNKFNSIPVFVANTLQDKDYLQDIPDTFAVSVKSITENEAVVQVWKVSNPATSKSWGQNLRLCWIAMSED